MVLDADGPFAPLHHPDNVPDYLRQGGEIGAEYQGVPFIGDAVNGKHSVAVLFPEGHLQLPAVCKGKTQGISRRGTGNRQDHPALFGQLDKGLRLHIPRQKGFPGFRLHGNEPSLAVQLQNSLSNLNLHMNSPILCFQTPWIL